MTLRQFLMLKYMSRSMYTEQQAILFRQRTFGSLCKNQWVNYNAHKKRFYVTQKGRKALFEEHNKTYFRHKDSATDFSAIVREHAFGGKIAHKVVQMRKAS